MRLSAALLVVCCCLGITLANPRARRSACEDTSAKYEACVASAQLEHQEKLNEGDDGRDHFYSRKSCNFIEKAVGECGDLLIGDCYSAETVLEMKDNQFKSIVEGLEQVEEWDSSKCDSIKEWMDRMEAAAGAAVDADADGDGMNDPEDNDDAANDDNNDDDQNPGATDDDDDDTTDAKTEEDQADLTDGDNAGDNTPDDNTDNPDDDTKTGENGGDDEDEEAENGAGHIVSLPLLTLAVLLFK